MCKTKQPNNFLKSINFLTTNGFYCLVVISDKING